MEDYGYCKENLILQATLIGDLLAGLGLCSAAGLLKQLTCGRVGYCPLRSPPWISGSTKINYRKNDALGCSPPPLENPGLIFSLDENFSQPAQAGKYARRRWKICGPQWATNSPGVFYGEAKKNNFHFLSLPRFRLICFVACFSAKYRYGYRDVSFCVNRAIYWP